MNFRDYPWVWPPAGFIPFDKNGSAALQPGSFVAAVVDIPTRFGGWLTLAGIELSDFTSAFFQILQGGLPVRDYAQVSVPLGAPETPAVLYVELRPGQPLSLIYQNNSGGTLAARWRLYGWYYPND